jgi:hypothetical protein
VRRAQGGHQTRWCAADAVGHDAEDADESKRECHGGEDAEEDGEKALAAVLGVALDGFVEDEGAVEAAGGDLLVGSDGCDGAANGMQVGEWIALGADEELQVGQHHGGVRKVDGGHDGAIYAVVASIADNSDDLMPGGALSGGDLKAILTCETGNAQLSAQRIGRGKIARRESAIDDGGEVSAGVFICIPDATAEAAGYEAQRNTAGRPASREPAAVRDREFRRC